MELLGTDTPRVLDARITSRRSPIGDLVASVFVAALAVVPFVFRGELAGQPLLFWVVGGPVLLIMALVWLIMLFTLIGSFRSSLRPTNWLARVESHGVYLNLRSYKNGHFEGDDPTVVYLEFQEIERAQPVTEKITVRRRNKVSVKHMRAIELELRDIDTTALEDAVRLERVREAPGVRSRTKHHHVPIFVAAPGRVRVEWDAELFRSLKGAVPMEPAQQIDLEDQLASLPPEDRARSLVLRGQRFQARRLAEDELGLSKSEAEDWLDERARKSA